MDSNRLRAAMVLRGETGAILAKALGISQQTLSAKMTGRSEFTQKEIWKIKERYGLTPSDVDDIFFARYVS